VDDRDAIAHDGDALARRTLSGFGASGHVLDGLLAYTANPFDLARVDVVGLPLADGPQLDAWEDYAQEARRDGVLPALARRLVQLQFPIAQGISQTDAYLAATRRGVFPSDGEGGERSALPLEDPDGLELVLQPTLAGRVPIITCRTRQDFVALVRACSCRNEPERVPDSMGACIVNGLNNWDRIARLRRQLEEARGTPFDEREWTQAFREIVPQKPLYQDRLIILSRDPYSGVPAAALGIDERTWREQSTAIRAEHECTHYFTLVAFGVMRNNLLDEVIADFAGLARIFRRYDARAALRFLGLEAHPEYRAGGRFENYLTTPPIDGSAVPILREIVVRAAHAIEECTADLDLAIPSVRGRMVVALAASTLVELASSEGVVRLRARLTTPQQGDPRVSVYKPGLTGQNAGGRLCP
jgi:hypothetical protein